MEVQIDRSKAADKSPVADAPEAPLTLNKAQIVLMLQGGGALGSYQVGAFEALAAECEALGNKIDWVAGISIGAINSAVIAAPKCGDSVRELELLWDEFLSPEFPPFDYRGLVQAWLPEALRPWIAAIEPKYMDWTWMAFNPWGQPNFFSSRVLDPTRNPWVQQWFRKLNSNELAFYGTRRMAKTLDRHVDWRALKNPNNTRLSLGATRVCDGELEFFDSRNMDLNADHVRASGALPPAFPPVQIGPEWYFDGGVCSNTPIEFLWRQLSPPKEGTIVFLIDLWDRKNEVLPESLEDVLWRQKSIQYGSRKKAAEIVVERYQYRAACASNQPAGRLEIRQVMLEHPANEPQFCFADADFSRSTFTALRAQGFKDMTAAIHHPELATDQQGHPFGGKYAMLYRRGSHDKWKADRTRHRHQVSNRTDIPPVFEPWLAWLKRIA